MVTFNPYKTTSGQGLFQGKSSTGYVQGTAMPDPSTRFALRQGALASDEALPMWGGIGVFENVPGAPNGPNRSLGPIMGRATALTGAKALAGFCVFDQAYNMLNWAGSPVPLAFPGNSIMSYRLGSGARIALACDPALVDLIGDPIGSQVAYDFVNGLLVPYTGANAVANGVYDTVTGLVTLTMTDIDPLSPGDTVIISGATGTGSFASINGSHTTLDPTDGTTVTFKIATGLTMTITGGSLTTGTALVNVSVLDVQADNCMTVDYDSIAQDTSWNYDGACALVQI